MRLKNNLNQTPNDASLVLYPDRLPLKCAGLTTDAVALLVDAGVAPEDREAERRAVFIHERALLPLEDLVALPLQFRGLPVRKSELATYRVETIP